MRDFLNALQEMKKAGFELNLPLQRAEVSPPRSKTVKARPQTAKAPVTSDAKRSFSKTNTMGGGFVDHSGRSDKKNYVPMTSNRTKKAPVPSVKDLNLPSSRVLNKTSKPITAKTPFS